MRRAATAPRPIRCAGRSPTWVSIPALVIMIAGCSRGPSAVFSPTEFARESLRKSYAAKAELGEIEEVKPAKSEGAAHSFAVKGSKRNATMTLLSVTPKGDPEGTLWLDDGRQVPLFIPFVEESYKEDLEREKASP